MYKKNNVIIIPLKSNYNHIICIMEGETKNIRFVLKIYRFVLRLLNISFCGLYIDGGTLSIDLPDNIITNILFGSKKSISFTKTDFYELKSLITAE